MADIILRTRKIAEGVIFKFTILSLILLILLLAFFSFTSANAELFQENLGANITNDIELAGNFTLEGRVYKNGKFEKFGKFKGMGEWEYYIPQNKTTTILSIIPYEVIVPNICISNLTNSTYPCNITQVTYNYTYKNISVDNSTWVPEWVKGDNPQQVRYCSDFQREFVAGRGRVFEGDHVPKTKWILALNRTEIRFSSACSYYDVNTTTKLRVAKVYENMTWWNSSLFNQYQINIINTENIPHIKEILRVNISSTICDDTPALKNSTRIVMNNAEEIPFESYNSSFSMLYVIANFSTGAGTSATNLSIYCNSTTQMSAGNSSIFLGRDDFEGLTVHSQAGIKQEWTTFSLRGKCNVWGGSGIAKEGSVALNCTADGNGDQNLAYNFSETTSQRVYANLYTRIGGTYNYNPSIFGFSNGTVCYDLSCGYAIISSNPATNFWRRHGGVIDITPLVAERWETFKFEYNPANQNLSIYVNGTFAIVINPYPELNSISGFVFGGYGSGNNNGQLDNLFVSIHNSTIYETPSNISLVEVSAEVVTKSIILNTPSDNSYSNNRSINFTFTPSTGNVANFTNTSLWTNISGTFAITHWNQTGIINGSLNGINYTFDYEGSLIWNIQACAGNTCTFSEFNRTLTIDTTDPSINFSTGTMTTNTTIRQTFVFANWTFTEINLQNITAKLYNLTTKVNETNFPASTLEINWSSLPYTRYFYNISICDKVGNCNYTETRNITLNAPPTTTLNITPLIAYTNDNLTCNNGSITDPEGDPVSISAWDWYNSTSWIGLNSSNLADNYTQHFQVWNCSITLSEGYGNTTYYSANTVNISNTAPTTPTNMSPADGYRDTDNSVLLGCNGSTDIDNDILNYSYYGDTSSATTHLGNGTNYTWSGLANGTTYYWRCRTWDGSNFSNYTSTISFRENRLPYASVYITPSNPTPGTQPSCNLGSTYDYDGDAISVIAYDWFSTSWLGLNSSTLASSYVISNSAWKCSITITDTYENITINSTQVSVSSGCLTNTSFKFEYASTQNYTSLNFSSLAGIVYPDLHNVITDDTAFFYANYTMLVNTTSDPNILIYVGGDTLNLSYQNTTIPGDINLTITQTNLSQLNPFYLISLKTEDISTEWNLSRADTLLLKTYCANSQLSLIDLKDWNKSQIKLSLKELPELLIVEANTTFYRKFVPHSSLENISIYLIDTDIATPIYLTFLIEDYTGLFNEAILRIKKQMIDSIAEITSDRFGIDDKIYTYLLEGGRYQLILEKGENQRQIGWLIITSLDTTKTLQITSINISGISIYQDVVSGFAGDYNSSTVSLQYRDKLSKTIDVGFFVYAQNDSLLYEGHSSLANTTISYIVPDVNATYKLRAEILHENFNITEIGIIRLLNVSKRMIDLSLPDTFLGMSDNRWYSIISVFLIGFVSLIFGALHSGAGGLIVAGVASFFVLIGWLSVSHIIISVVLLIAILAKLTERRVVV